MEETSVGAGLSAVRKEDVEKHAVARMFFERVYYGQLSGQGDGLLLS
jgi:hypothetical protein